MSGRQFHFIWTMVACLTAFTIGLLQKIQPEDQTAHKDPASDEPIPDAPVVVIGSSLMMYAVPGAESGEQSLLGDGRGHIRLGVGSITESQTITLLERVLESQAECIFIEIQPLGMDLAHVTRREQGIRRTFLHELIDQIRTFSLNSRRELGTRSGWRTKTPLRSSAHWSMTSEPSGLDAVFNIPRNSLERNYPIRRRPPAELGRLNRLLSLAKNRNTDVIMIAPPRSQTAVDYMGTARSISLEEHFQNLAEQLDVPLFQPARCWPDEYFIDQAHMNRRGRKRFCNELARWSSEQP
ncbi:MAG: hypothetical protein ACKVHE_21615 [Planctomycetales bacterium]